MEGLQVGVWGLVFKVSKQGCGFRIGCRSIKKRERGGGGG